MEEKQQKQKRRQNTLGPSRRFNQGQRSSHLTPQ